MDKFSIDDIQSALQEHGRLLDWREEHPGRREAWKFMTESYDKDDNKRRVFEVMATNHRILGMAMGRQVARQRGLSNVSERTLMTDVHDFITNSLPFVKCIYDQMCTELFTVQPITQYKAILPSLDYQYEDAHIYTPGASTCNHLDKDYGKVGEKGNVRGLKLVIGTEEIEAETRKLLADVSIEAKMRLLTEWNYSYDSQMTIKMAEELGRELNQDAILDALALAGAGNVNWNWTVPVAPSPYAVLDPKAYGATLYDAIEDAATLIYNLVPVEANYLIMHRNVYARLRKLEQFRTWDGSRSGSKRVGIEYVGTLNEKYTVCIASNFPDNTILVSYRGNGWDEAGYGIFPFVTFWTTDLWVDPRDFDQYRGAFSWIGKHMIRPNMFATVSLLP